MVIKALSLFSGIGGGDIALEWAGVRTVGMCEIDPYCQSILKQHFPNTPLFSDIKLLSPEQFDEIDILLTTYSLANQ